MRRVCLLLAVVVVAGLGPHPGALALEHDGAALYVRHCAPCHGMTGHGDGPDSRLFEKTTRDLTTGVLARYSTAELVERIRHGQPLTLALDPEAVKQQAAEVEALLAHLRKLAQVNWALVSTGWDMYSARCAQCHGLYGNPPAKLPNGVQRSQDLGSAAFQRTIGDVALREAVIHGRHGMPALTPQITGDATRPLSAFVRLLSPGFALYQRNCANCHGDDGRGERDAGDTEHKPTVVFDRAYFAHTDEEAIRTRIWHMVSEHTPAMPHFRTQLSATQVEAIVEYLKRTQK